MLPTVSLVIPVTVTMSSSVSVTVVGIKAATALLVLLMDRALFAVDPLTGLIVAATLMHPTKKLKNVDTQFVLNRFKEKRFAAGADRDTIRTCENLGLSLEDFITISLDGMKSVSDELGL